jgi:hypothetical protein
MTYTADNPMIPLRLTAVAAQPEMQVLVFIAGSSRYEPSNVPLILIDDDELRADPRNGDNNYHPLLAWKIDLVGGDGFVLETAMAGTTAAARLNTVFTGTADEEEARAWLADILNGQSMLTRLLTRASGDEMTVDPAFGATGSNITVDFVHDLRDQEAVYFDMDVNPPKPCNDLYCGIGGLCAVDENGREGCACADGWLARRTERPTINSLNQGFGVTCVDASFDLMADLPGIAGSDPCDGVSCGDGGTCVALGGSPTCDCADGGMAAMYGGALTCLEAIAAYPPEALLWGDVLPVGTEMDPPSCNGDGASGDGTGSPTTTGCMSSVGGAEGSLLALVIIAARRRRARV